MAGQSCSTRSLAVTRLTVYRQLQVPAQFARTPTPKNNYVLPWCGWICFSPDPVVRIWRCSVASFQIHLSWDMQRGVAIHTLSAGLVANVLRISWVRSQILFCCVLAMFCYVWGSFGLGWSSRFPGGNLVDGLPPVASGAKHSPPVSDRGPICQKGGPPKSKPETPLAKVFTHQIFTKSIIQNTNPHYFWWSFEW